MNAWINIEGLPFKDKISGMISSCFQSKANAVEALLKTAPGCRFLRLRDLQVPISKRQSLCRCWLNKTGPTLPSVTEGKWHSGAYIHSHPSQRGGAHPNACWEQPLAMQTVLGGCSRPFLQSYCVFNS